MKKTLAGTVAGVIMAGAAVTGCGTSNGYSGYDYVYDTHTHHYVYVSDSYYHSHRSLYSGTPKHVTNNYVQHNHITVVHPTSAPKVSKAPLHKRISSAVKSKVSQHKAKSAAKRSTRRH